MTTERTGCGEPRLVDAGTDMTVFGWVDRRRDLGGLTFLDIRDRSGILQVVLNPTEAAAAHAAAKEVRGEWVLRVGGTLRARTEGTRNARLTTGDVELMVSTLEVLSVARTPPFLIGDDAVVDERVRLRHRYLDLRRPRLQRNLRARARFIAALRRSMEAMEFTEIETPMMVRATPEGARDYLVPSRISSGSFYALPQSPQIYKQLCMVGGLDRYFQIARCMRDEDLRADRQPEFTQLDVEMSFVDEEDVYAVIERGLREAWAAAEFRGQPPDPFPRMAWRQAMEQYGSDKPDLRFGLQLHDLTDVARTSSFRVFAQAVERGGILKAIRVPGGTDLTRSDIEGRLLDVVKLHRARGLAYLWLRSDANAPMPADAEAAAASLAVGSATPGGTWDGQITKFLTAEELARIGAITGAEPGDCVLMVADRATVVHAALSALRAHLGRERRLYEPDAMAWLWVTDFPMFERDDETGAISPAHHPFTSPVFEDIPLLDSDPTRVRSRAYDIVVNGREIGSGSIRITDPVLQRRIFASLGIDEAGAEEKFGFLLEAFEYGVPPHGGFAAGIERLVMEGLGEESIRDVIAFPKNQQAQEVMTGAPAPVDAGQLADLGLSLRPPRPT